MDVVRTPHGTTSTVARGASPERPPAIVAGGRSAGLAVIRSLGQAGIPVVCVWHNPREWGRLSKYVSRSVRAPDPLEVDEDYIGVLDELAAEYEGALLVPTTDESLAAIARHKAGLEDRLVVACMDAEGVEGCLNKATTYEMADRAGVPTPQSFSPASSAQLKALRTVLRFPCLLKPTVGHLYLRTFRRKMTMVYNYGELQRAWLEAYELGLEVMVQEFVPGPDHNGVNYNAYVWNGEVLADYTAHKLRSWPEQVGSPRLVLSRNLPEVVQAGRRLVLGVGVQGFVNVEFKLDAGDGVFKLMEINARHNMSSALSVRCGVNFPLMQYRHLIADCRPEPCTAAEGIYWISLVADMERGLQLAKRGRLPRGYARPYFSPRVYDYPDWRDPGPFAGLMWRRLKRFGARRLPPRLATTPSSESPLEQPFEPTPAEDFVNPLRERADDLGPLSAANADG